MIGIHGRRHVGNDGADFSCAIPVHKDHLDAAVTAVRLLVVPGREGGPDWSALPEGIPANSLGFDECFPHAEAGISADAKDLALDLFKIVSPEVDRLSSGIPHHVFDKAKIIRLEETPFSTAGVEISCHKSGQAEAATATVGLVARELLARYCPEGSVRLQWGSPFGRGAMSVTAGGISTLDPEEWFGHRLAEHNALIAANRERRAKRAPRP